MDFKGAIAISLLIKGDRSSCDNYRGISVLSRLAKLVKRLICLQITAFFKSNSFFSAAQNGLRSNHNCKKIPNYFS